MKKRIFAIIALSVILAAIVAVPASAYEVVPNNYKNVENYFDLEKGITSQDFGPSKIDGVYLKRCVVKSAYFDQAFRTKLAVSGNEYKNRYKDWDEQGFFPSYETQNQTLNITVERGGANDDFTQYDGHFDSGYYNSEEDSDGFYKQVSVTANISFSVSNVKYENYRVTMDIDGYVKYSYDISGKAFVSDSWDDAKYERFNSFKESVKEHVNAEDTYRTFSKKGAETEFYLDKDTNTVKLRLVTSEFSIWFDVVGVLPHGGAVEPGGTVVKVENPASTETGEVDVSVPAGIVIGIIGGGAAVIAAAGAGDGKGDTTDDEKKKSYKMYVGKDFGDAIRKGDPPVKVRARMVEVDEGGVEHDRDDLTAMISVKADGLIIEKAINYGRNIEVEVTAENDDAVTKGYLTFIFTGAGGTFENTVVFRVVGDPYLQFIENGSEAGTVKHLGNKTTFRAIGGDGFTYKIRFTLVDATEEPKKLSADENEDFTVTFEQDPAYQFTYFAVLKNKSQPMSCSDGFTKPRITPVYITAEMANDHTGEGTIGAYLYPEGLSVTTDAEIDENHTPKPAIAKAYEKEYVGDLDAKFTQIRFYYTLAVKTATESKFPSVKEAGIKFGQMVGDTENDKLLAEKYESGTDYAMIVTDSDDGAFEPKTMLWEPLDKSGIYVYIPARCEYEGKKYETKVYIRLRGKDQDPMAEWNAEYEKLIYRVKKYVPQEQWHNYLQKVKRIAEEPRKGVEEMRLMGKDMARAYRDYWWEQGKNAQWWANAWDWMTYGAEWTKWIGDCAFSILCNIYGGPLADALLSPAKDVFTSLVGEVGVNIVWGTKFNIDNLECFEALRTAGDNIVGNWATDGVKNILKSGSSWKAKAGMIAGALAANLVYLSVSNYLKKLNEDPENASFWRAIADGFKDLTKNFLKACIGDLIGKWLKSESFQKGIGKKVEGYIIEHFGKDGKLPEVFKDVEMDWLDDEGNIVFTKAIDVVETYLSNLCGEGAAKYVDKPSLGFKMNDKGEITYTFTITWWDKAPFPVEINLSKALTNTACGLFGWIYDELCGDLPTASAVAEIPTDPPLPSEAKNVKQIPVAPKQS
ncbi:MAG: hypothetical protein J5832_04690 [Clostridia bacterium]|nr:hypothetical protein [Clostridia bacterium]